MPTTCAGLESMRERTPDGCLVAAESPLPERIGKNDGRRTIAREAVLLRREPAPVRRLHAQRLKRALRDEKSAQTLRLAAIRQRRGAVLPEADVRKGPVLVAVREVHCGLEVRAAQSASGAMPKPHELVRVRVRQRLDQHGVDDAEDRSGCADPEREREHGGKRECRPPRQATQRVAQIATERIGKGADRHSTSLRARCRRHFPKTLTARSVPKPACR